MTVQNQGVPSAAQTMETVSPHQKKTSLKILFKN